MADVHDPLTRSRNMAAIKSRNTTPELCIRKALHATGLRYRLHAQNLPGKPDIVLPKYRAVIFVNGCFWHQHDCHLFKWPATRTEFWRLKIEKNVINDARARISLQKAGWRIAVIWECALKGKERLDERLAIQDLVAWIKSEHETIIIRGRQIG